MPKCFLQNIFNKNCFIILLLTCSTKIYKLKIMKCATSLIIIKCNITCRNLYILFNMIELYIYIYIYMLSRCYNKQYPVNEKLLLIWATDSIYSVV